MASYGAESKEGNPINPPKRMKIIVLGANSVGKTSLIRQFIYGKVQLPSDGVVEDFYTTNMDDVDGGKLHVDILDTTSDLAFPQVMRLAIQTGDAFVLVYAVDDKDSYEKISGIKEMIMKERKRDEKKVSIVIVGNKTDLDPSTRETSKEVVQTIVNIDWGCGYMEISTRDKEAVDNVFRELLLRYRSHPGGSAALGQRRMTSPAEMFTKLKRRLTLKKQKSVV